MARQEPQRSCLGCRTVRDKKDLLRFVLSPDREVVPDLQSRLPGRGAYTCRTTDCLKLAVTKKQFSRAFKGEAKTGDDLCRVVRELLEQRLASYIALANKAGKVVSGSDVVTESLRKQKVGMVVLARDISADIGEKFSTAAARSGADVVWLLDKERLGILLGKELRSVAAIEKSGFTKTMNSELTKYRNFFEGGAQEK